MNTRFTLALGGLLPHHLSSQVKELYLSALLQNLALSMLLLFEPIYLWQQGFGVRGVLAFFLGVYLVYIFLMPVGANFATHFGYHKSMVLSTIFQICYYGSLYLIADNFWWVIPAVLLYPLQKSFYWPAYHADFARYSDASEQGKEISGLSVVLSMVYILGPLLAGVILLYTSWFWFFLFSSLILLASNIPLLFNKENFVPRDFPYLDALKRLFSRHWRWPLYTYFGFGEELIAMTLWPIFIIIMVPDYAELGLLISLSTLIMSAATLYAGKLADIYDKHKLLRLFGSSLVFSWLARILVNTPWTVWISDFWQRTNKNVLVVPLTALTYERAKNASVMDTVVFFEMGLAVGKVLAALVLIIVMSFFESWSLIWLVAACFALLYSLF